MNPLAHAHFVLELVKQHHLTQDEQDHLIVGSILPDIHITGLIHFQRTHCSGLGFFHSVKNPLHRFLALGIISHGEEPQGLDYYAHQNGGFISRKQEPVLQLAQSYKKSLGEVNEMTAHHLIEFSVDNLVAEKNPAIVQLVLTAFQNPKVKYAITAFSNYLGFSERKNRKIIKLLSNRNLLNYFRNCSHPETASQNWLNLTFYRNLKKGKDLPLREKIKKLTAFSYYNFKRRLSNRHLTRMFQEINFLLRDDASLFIFQSQKDLVNLKNELFKQIYPQARREYLR